MTNATDILEEAIKIVTGPRRGSYGEPAVSFQRIATLWEPVLGRSVEPWQVALCLAQLKVARIVNNPLERDSWTDLAGYSALGAEVAGVIQ